VLKEATSCWLGSWLFLISVVRRSAPEARREVSPARERWVNCFRMRAPEARHLVSHIFSECDAYRFQHKRAAENHSNADEGTPIRIYRGHSPAPESFCPRHCVEDHIHMLLQFPATLTIADAVNKIKANSPGGCPVRSAGSCGNRGTAGSG
jgi:hypothetical protein